MQNELFTVREVHTRLRVAKSTVLAWIKQGKLKALKCGNRVLIERSELDRFISEARKYGQQQG